MFNLLICCSSNSNKNDDTSNKNDDTSNKNDDTLKTTLGFSHNNGPYYKIKNAKIISNKFKTIIFTVKDALTNNIKITKSYNVTDLKFKNNKIKLDINQHPTVYPYMCFYINNELIYEQKYHIIVDVEITLNNKYKIKNIEDILTIKEETFNDM